MIAPSRLRGRVLAAMRAHIPMRNRPSTCSHWRRCPPMSGWAGIGSLAGPEPLSAFVPASHDALPGTSWGVRAAGDADATVSRVAVCGGAGDSLLDAVRGADVQAYVTADLRHHPADEHRRVSRWRLSTSRTGQASSPGARRRPMSYAATSVTHYPCGCQRLAPTRGMSRDRVMKAEVDQQRSLLELAQLDAERGRIEHRAGNLAELQGRGHPGDTSRGQRPAWPPCRSRWRTSTAGHQARKRDRRGPAA